MARYEVHIVEILEGDDFTDPPADARNVKWQGEAPDEQAAKTAGYRSWTVKYGAGADPASAIVRVTPVPR